MNDKFKMIGQLGASILIAFLLFFYATTTNYKNSVSTSQSQAKETYTNTVNNVPIIIEYDSEKYFISGFASTVTVDLIGSNRLILQRETDEATRTFQVKADLRELEAGEHMVKLQVLDLPTGVSANLTPANLSVKIGRRASKEFAVTGRIYDTQLAVGYSVSKITVGTTSVKVTSDEETLAKVTGVEAVITDVSDLSQNYTGTATLQAVDAQGQILPVVFSQEVTSMQATITKNKE